MKKIISLITITIILSLTSCKDKTLDPIIIEKIDTITITVVTTNTITNVITNNVAIPDGPVDFFTYENDSIFVYNGTKLLWTNTKATYAGKFRIAISNVLYYLDNNRNITNSVWLPTVPDLIAIRGNDIFMIKKIDPQTAYDSGGLYKHYTEIWKNGSTINHWSLNQFESDKIIITENSAIIKKAGGTYQDIEGFKINIFYADSDCIIHGYDVSPNVARFCWNGHDFNKNWVQNWLGNALSFQVANDTLYSPNGYHVTSDGIMYELQNQLTNFNIIISAEMQNPYKLCVRTENSEEVTYWLECNTGDVYRHIPSIDLLQKMTSFYSGNGLSVTGQNISKELDPFYMDNKIYYYYNGVTWQYDFNASYPFGNVMEIWG
jgi:hypothetical protein